MTHERVMIAGHLLLEVTGADGTPRARAEATNSVVDGGRDLLAALLAGTAMHPRFQLTAGVDDSATVADLTKLFNPDGLEPIPVEKTEVRGGTVRLQGSYPAAERDREIREAGLLLTCRLDPDEVTTLYNRALVRPAQDVRKGEILTLTWTLSFAPHRV